MSFSQKMTTTVSTKGQVVLPKSIREQRRWPAGTELVVVDTEDGVLLKPASRFAPKHPDEVFGMLHYNGPAKTVEEMEAAVMAEAKRRHACSRY